MRCQKPFTGDLPAALPDPVRDVTPPRSRALAVLVRRARHACASIRVQHRMDVLTSPPPMLVEPVEHARRQLSAVQVVHEVGAVIPMESGFAFGTHIQSHANPPAPRGSPSPSGSAAPSTGMPAERAS